MSSIHADLSVEEYPLSINEFTNYGLVQEMLNEALLRGFKADHGSIGETNEFWIQVNCEPRVFAEIERAAREQLCVAFSQAARAAKLMIARKSLGK